MDSYEATRIVFTKLQNLDPEYASKIMGLLLIQDHGEKEMIRLAFGPDSLLQSVIIKARKELGVSSPLSPSSPLSLNSRFIKPGITNLPSPLSTTSFRTNSNTSGFQPPESRLNSSAPPFYGGAGEPDLIDELHLQNQLSFLDDDSPATGFNSGDVFSHRRSFSVNDMTEHCDEIFRSNSGHRRRLLMTAGGGVGGGGGGSFSNFPFQKNPNFYLQQQSGSPRMAATAAAALMTNYGSRQIYLTFPADSSFTEEDVSNYFSVYGPVQDVRIPYQPKRMFGFVTFVYAETVKLILAKGNPHFVCEARVLVKPYKEKGKVPDKFRKYPQQQLDSPTRYDSHDPFDLQLAIELQNRRIMDLQLLDMKRNHHNYHHHQRALSTGAAILSPTSYSPSYLNRSSVFASDSSSSSSPDSDDGLVLNLPSPVTINGDGSPFKASLNVEKEKEASDFKDENHSNKSSPRHEEDNDFPKSLEHNLPDNLFASPKKSKDHQTIFSNDKNALVSSITSINNLITSPLTSTLDMASLKSCYFEYPRFSSDHGAVGM
ncbi:zinc finger CCCH domain-containing protein 53-like [Bidens hawaiensis]|uniref:zinc finger CCCH domain-containing protein 53-like n=1 Tax=Bidens hawaiensis TaxID=980011 RepID=UPI00404B34C1